MTVLHTGSTKAYAENWEQIFGKGGAATSRKPSAKRGADTAVKKKRAKKGAARRGAKKAGR